MNPTCSLDLMQGLYSTFTDGSIPKEHLNSSPGRIDFKFVVEMKLLFKQILAVPGNKGIEAVFVIIAVKNAEFVLDGTVS